MTTNKSNIDNKDVHIEQLNPQKDLTDLEKTAIMQFKIDEEENKKEEQLSKTQKFKLLNSRKKDVELDLPKTKPSLSDTIRLKISDLREAIDQKNKEDLELPTLKKKKPSLYDTVIIKLDDLINSKSALKQNNNKKVKNIENVQIQKSKFHLFKPRDITKMKNFKINVDSEEFGRQLYNLNKLALMNLSLERPKKVRRYNVASKLEKIDNIHISRHNYLQYQTKLNRFAIDKLYYKFAPKESKKYKLYKYSVILSGFVFFVTSVIIANWFMQGVSINNISNALIEQVEIVEVAPEEGELYNVPEAPEPEKKEEYSNKNTMYWRYLNTPLSSVDFTELKKQNGDTVGWIIVNNTNVNYPVVQTSNNDYYLNHAFDRSSNGAGWVFADFRNNFDVMSKNTVIYAHGRKDKVMFGSLTNTLSPNWYTNVDNQIIQLSTLKYNTMWQIFSVYKIQAESYYITTDFSSDTSFMKFANSMKERSIYDFGVDINKDDKLLTLSTCYNDNGIRLVVQAKLVKVQER
jgi:sortase B